MKALSKIVKIPYTNTITTEYVEKELTKLNISPLRWAIINVSDTIITVDVAYLKI